MPLVLPNPARLDGLEIVDANGVSRTVMSDSTIDNDQNYTRTITMAGSYRATYRLGTYNGMRGPVGDIKHRWVTNSKFIDSTLFPIIQRKCLRPITHTLALRWTDTSFYDMDGSATEIYLGPGRQILSNSYTESAAGLGVNGGATADSLIVRRLDTGTNLTIIYARTLQVLDFAALVGATVTVSITNNSGVASATVLTGVAGAAGLNEFQAAVSDEATATSLAAAIDAISGIAAASGGTDTVTVTKDATTTCVLTITTSAIAADLAIRPTTGEVCLDIAGVTGFRWRNFKFGDTIGSGQAVIMVQGHMIYSCAAAISSWAYPGTNIAELYTSSTLIIEEL